MDEKLTAAEAVDATILRGAGMTEHAEAHGFYTVECIRNGEVIWTDIIPNTVVTVGKTSPSTHTLRARPIRSSARSWA
jgi:hypothetical protein